MRALHVSALCRANRQSTHNFGLALREVQVSVDALTAIPIKISIVDLQLRLFAGLRYPLVGGTRQRRFARINLQPRKLPENAATPTNRVHAVLGGSAEAMFFVQSIHCCHDL